MVVSGLTDKGQITSHLSEFEYLTRLRGGGLQEETYLYFYLPVLYKGNILFPDDIFSLNPNKRE